MSIVVQKDQDREERVKIEAIGRAQNQEDDLGDTKVIGDSQLLQGHGQGLVGDLNLVEGMS